MKGNVKLPEIPVETDGRRKATKYGHGSIFPDMEQFFLVIILHFSLDYLGISFWDADEYRLLKI